MAELKLVVGADVKEAEQALRSLVSNIEKTTAVVQKFSSDISKSFLPVHNINNFRKAFDALKSDLGNVKITEIPPIDIDTSPAQLALKSLIADVNKAGGSIDNLSQEVNDSFKGVKIAAIPPIVLNVDPAKQSLRSLVGSIEQTEASVEQLGGAANNSLRQPLHSIDAITKSFLALKKDLSNVTFSAIPPVTADIKPAQQSLQILTQQIKDTGLSVGGISAAFDRFSKDVNSSVSSLSVRSLENFNKAFIAFKADLSNAKITALPPITVDIKPAQDALKTLATNVDTAIDAVKSDLNNVKISTLPPINIDTDPARQSLRVFVQGVDQTAAQVKKLSGEINNSLTVSAIPTIDANIAPAQQKLEILANQIKSTGTSVSGISERFQKFSTDVNKSLGVLSTNSLENFKRAFFDLKNDLSNVTFSALPAVKIDISPAKQSLQAFEVAVDSTIANVRADLQNVKVAAIPPVTIDTAPAERELKDLVNTVNTTVVSFRQIGSDINKSFSALPFNIEKFRQAFLDFKADLNSVTIAPIPPVNIDIRPATQSLQTLIGTVDKTIDVVKSDLSNVKISSLPPIGVNIKPAQESLRVLADEAKVTGSSITGISTSIERFSADVRTSLGALPLHNIEAFRQAFLSFKSDLGKITIAAIPPIKIDVGSAQQSLQTLSQEAQKTGSSVGNVATSFERFSQNIARSFGALPLSSIAAFREAFLNFKSDLTNVKISTIPPVKVDISQAQNSLRTLTVEAEKSGTTVNSLSAQYQRWAAQAATSSGVAANALREVNEGVTVIEGTAKRSFGAIVANLDQTGAAVQKFGGELNKSIGTLPLTNINELRQGILALKADLGSVKITAIPPISADVRPAQQALQTLTHEAQESGAAIVNVSSAYQKWAQQVSQSSGQATTAIKEVDLTVETLRAKIATRRDLIVTEKDISKIEKYNKEIESLESVLTQVQNAGKTGFFTGAPFDRLTDKTLKANRALQQIPRGSNSAGFALQNLARIAQDAPFGFIAIQNNLTELLPAFQRLRAESGSTGAALKSFFGALTGVGGIGLVFSVLTSVLTVLSLRSREAKDDTKELNNTISEAEEKQKALSQAVDKAASSIISQAATLKDLRALLISTAAASVELTDATIKQGLARFIFDEKNVELQKIISAQIQKQIILRKRVAGLAGTPEFIETDPEIQKLVLFEKKMREAGVTSTEFFQSLRGDINTLKALNRTIGGSIGEINLLNALGPDLNNFFKTFLDKPGKAGDKLEDFIARAKQLAAELEKIGFIAPAKFSFFDSFQEQLVKARKVFADFNSGNLKINPAIFTFPSFSEPQIKERVQDAVDIVKEGIRIGVIGLPHIPLNVDVNTSLVTNLSQNANLIREFSDRFKNLKKLFPDIDLDLSAGLNRGLFVDSLRKFFKAGSDVTQEEILRFGDQTEAALDNLAKAINSSIQGLAVEGFSSIGAAIGTALASGDVSGVFKAFGNSVAEAVSAIGKQFISLGVAALLAKKALATLFAQPGLAIAAGTALIAVAAALRTALAKGVTGFAEGGLVFGPTLGLIGEGAGTSRSNPEIIAPLDKLKGILGDSGGRAQPILLRTIIRGNDILLSNSRTNRSNNRLR